MEILTTDNRRLCVVRFGEMDSEAGTNTVLCKTPAGGRVKITPQDIAMFFGSYSMPAGTEVKREQ